MSPRSLVVLVRRGVKRSLVLQSGIGNPLWAVKFVLGGRGEGVKSLDPPPSSRIRLSKSRRLTDLEQCLDLRIIPIRATRVPAVIVGSSQLPVI
jgi:hypothetical protein